MAGAGSRFAKVGYTFPKPLISVHGDPMISVVVKNLNLQGQHIFCVQKTHCEKYELETLLNHLSPLQCPACLLWFNINSSFLCFLDPLVLTLQR